MTIVATNPKDICEHCHACPDERHCPGCPERENEMSKCPGCDLELRTDNLQAQKGHMEEHHRNIVARRLESAGFEKTETGWRDTLSGATFE